MPEHDSNERVRSRFTEEVGLDAATIDAVLALFAAPAAGDAAVQQNALRALRDAHAGSEISATGDITVWGEIRGIAHAGSQGDYRAEIRAMKTGLSGTLAIGVGQYWLGRIVPRVIARLLQAAPGLQTRIATGTPFELIKLRVFRDEQTLQE